MSYTPTEWKAGDVIATEKLNNMESGIAGAGSVYLAEMVFSESSDKAEFLDTNFSIIKMAVEYQSLIIFWAKRAIDNNTSVIKYFLPDTIVLNANGGGNINVGGIIFVAENDRTNPSYEGQ